MEHINAACKYAIVGLGSNVSPQAISHIGKCNDPLTRVCDRYDAVFGLQGLSGVHDMPSLSKDIAAVVKNLDQRSSNRCFVARKEDVTDLANL